MSKNQLLCISARMLLKEVATPYRQPHWRCATNSVMGVLTFGNAEEWHWLMHEIVWC